MIEIPTTPDKDVPMDRPAQGSRGFAGIRDPDVRAAVMRFADYKPGQSFFVPGIQPADLEWMRRPVKQAGLAMLVRRVEQDDIYGTAGVRVWRLQGTYDTEL